MRGEASPWLEEMSFLEGCSWTVGTLTADPWDIKPERFYLGPSCSPAKRPYYSTQPHAVLTSSYFWFF